VLIDGLMRMLLATALAAVVLSATTEPATDVTTTTATLHGTVEDATDYMFQYGTTSAYGLDTGLKPVDGPDVQAALTGLTSNTTYHYRVIAVNGADTEVGGDMTFTTTANPAPPGVADSRSSAITPAGVTLAGNVDPRGAPTTYYFQYGTTTSYGARRPTPAGELAPGIGEVPVAVTLDGLQPYTRYHWRLVATNAAGATRGRDHTFRTDRVATAVTVGVSRHRVSYGRGVSLGGRVSGAGVNGMTLALQQAQFPFDQGFRDVRTTRAGRDGGYLFSVDNVWSTTRFRVVTRTQTVVASPTVTVGVRVRPNARARLRTRKRARIQGLIVPAVSGTVTLQRRRADGIWRTLRSVAVQPPDATGTPYRFDVWRARKITRRYRVRVRLFQPGAYVGATSRAVKVSPRPAPARARRAAAG
jgi:hypothetical protein